ncbi:MAG: bifunctional adenosylcobinamide kinase/adenosylcobinamide-phosphate guanylyltransferase [Gammaproteobacteria bacterium]
MKTLILGGARSGKSRFAEELILDSKLHAIYIATATANDPEMAARIKQHQQQRGSQWHNIEEPVKIIKILQQTINTKNYVMVDCLTLWLSNLLQQNALLSDTSITTIEQQCDDLCDALKDLDGDVIFVSNEVGLGIVPLGELTRQFCDLAGRLHQQLAKQCDQVIFMVAGIPQIIKSPVNQD